MIYRTYGCDKCDVEFTAAIEEDEEPSCLKCKGPVHWVPAAGHGGIMSGATRAQDGYFKAQSARYGLTNLNSARTGEAMAPRDVTPPKQTGPVEIAPGISIPIQLNSANQPVTSVQNFIPTKGMEPTFGSAMPIGSGKTMPSLASITEVAGRYDGRK